MDSQEVFTKTQPKTLDLLAAAFAGESQANRKYLFFADKAAAEGHKQIARLFRAAADAETVHARNHLRVMQGVKSTKENLQAAINGEHYEFTKMYPEFIKQAEVDKDDKAIGTFDLANRVEQVNHTLYQKAADALDKGQKIEEKPIYVCQVCGNTIEGEAPDKCPICGAPKRQFKLIE